MSKTHEYDEYGLWTKPWQDQVSDGLLLAAAVRSLGEAQLGVRSSYAQRLVDEVIQHRYGEEIRELAKRETFNDSGNR